MLRLARFTALILPVLATQAAAKDPGPEASMVRVLACEGPDAKMEVYVPESVVFGSGGRASTLERPVIGYYTLDLTEANKGKMLEPVRVSLSADKKTVIVDQYTRKLPPTRVPVAGGTVDFDKRFGTAAKCGPFQPQG
jgi:hypothetical protein